MKKLCLAIIGALLISTHAHGMEKLKTVLRLVNPLDDQKMENRREDFPAIFASNTEYVTLNDRSYKRIPLSPEDNRERIRLELPVLGLFRYVIELQRQKVYGHNMPEYDYFELRKGYSLTGPGKVITGCSAVTLLILALKIML